MHDSVDLDYDKILQVMVNLISNAVKFSEEEDELKFSIVDNYNQVLLSIQDEGVGVPQSELSEIFGHFYQSSFTTNGAGGTGLGLPFPKELLLIIMDKSGRRAITEKELQ